MKLTIAREALLEEITLCTAVAARQQINPAVTGVHLSASADSETLFLRATDLEVALFCSVPAKIEKAGEALIPARRFFDVLSGATSDTVSIESDGNAVRIRAGVYNAKIQTLIMDDFPTIQTSAGTIENISGMAMLALIERTKYAMGAITGFADGAFFSRKADHWMIVATDGHRLAIAEAEAKGDDVEGRVLPRRAVQILADLLKAFTQDGDGQFDYCADENRAYFKLGSRALTVSLPASTYPDFRRVMPKKLQAGITIPRAEFLLSVQRVGLMADTATPHIKVLLDGKTLRIVSSNAGAGEADDEIAVKTKLKEAAVNLRPQYVEDFLTSVTSDNVELLLPEKPEDAELKGARLNQPALFRPAGESGCRCLIMPVQAGS